MHQREWSVEAECTTKAKDDTQKRWIYSQFAAYGLIHIRKVVQSLVRLTNRRRVNVMTPLSSPVFKLGRLR